MTDRLTDEELQEIREIVGHLFSRMESGQGGPHDAMCRLPAKDAKRLLSEVERLQEERVKFKAEVKRAVQRKCEMHNELADVKDTVRELHYNWTGVRIETLEQAVRFVVGDRDIRIRDLLEKVEHLEQRISNAEIHPTGRCVCCGEGDCQWCRMTELKEEVERLRSEVGEDAERQRYNQGLFHENEALREERDRLKKRVAALEAAYERARKSEDETFRTFEECIEKVESTGAHYEEKIEEMLHLDLFHIAVKSAIGFWRKEGASCSQVVTEQIAKELDKVDARRSMESDQ